MEVIKATKTVTIYGTSNAWSLGQSTDSCQASTESLTELVIQGDYKNGYHLIMSPEGFFTADSWHETREEAIEVAEELFSVKRSEWSLS